MSIRSTNTKVTAYHEAGHFVAAWAQGKAGDVYAVSIVPDPDSETLGHTSGDWGMSPAEAREEIEAEIITLYGGEATAFLPELDNHHTRGARDGCGDDRERAQALADRAGIKPRALRQLFKRAVALIAEHADVVRELAAELRTWKKLDGEECEQIAEAAQGVEGAREGLRQYRALRYRGERG